MADKPIVFYSTDEYDVAMNVATVIASTNTYNTNGTTLYQLGGSRIGPHTLVTEASKLLTLCERSPTSNLPVPVRITPAMTETWLACQDFHILIASKANAIEKQLRLNADLKLQEEIVEKPINICADCETKFPISLSKCPRCGGRGLRLSTAEEKAAATKIAEADAKVKD